MSVALRNVQRKLFVDRKLLQRQAQFAKDKFEAGKYRDHDATITLTNNRHMTLLNARYALLRKPTDVLSFRLADDSPRNKTRKNRKLLSFVEEVERLQNAPYLDPDTGRIITPDMLNDPNTRFTVPLVPLDLGQIFMSVEYCQRLARQRGVTRHDYLVLAMVHGLAHLVGHVHKNPRTYAAMRRAEVEVMTALSEEFGTTQCANAGDKRITEGSGKPPTPLSYLP